MPPKAPRFPLLKRHPGGRAYAVHQGRFYWCGRHGTDEAKEKYARLVVSITDGVDPGLRCHPGNTTHE